MHRRVYCHFNVSFSALVITLLSHGIVFVIHELVDISCKVLLIRRQICWWRRFASAGRRIRSVTNNGTRHTNPTFGHLPRVLRKLKHLASRGASITTSLPARGSKSVERQFGNTHATINYSRGVRLHTSLQPQLPTIVDTVSAVHALQPVHLFSAKASCLFLRAGCGGR